MSSILSQIIEVYFFRRQDAETQYLVLKRVADDGLYPGIWQTVTGTIKKDENAVKAAMREVGEETGMNIKRFWTVPFIDSFYDKSKDAVQLAPVFAGEVDGQEILKLSFEHQAYEWLAYAEAREKLVWPGQKQGLDIVNEFIAGGKEAARLLEITQF